jgi:hypothetical protein
LSIQKSLKETLNSAHHQALEELMNGLRGLYGERLKQAILYGCKNRNTQGSDLDVLAVIKGVEQRSTEISRIHRITGPITIEKNILITVIPVNVIDFERQRETAFFANILREGLTL